jgi:hypothetical protein
VAGWVDLLSIRSRRFIFLAGDLPGDLLGATFGNDTSGRVLLTLLLANGSNIQTVVTTSLASVIRRVR